MAAPNNGSSRDLGKRQSVDCIDGDIMRFSKTDFERLGLSSGACDELIVPHAVCGSPMAAPSLNELASQNLHVERSNMASRTQLQGTGLNMNSAGQEWLPTDPLPGLPRRRSRYFRTDAHRNTLSKPIEMPRVAGSADPSLNPMQRWRDSPPETEAASLSAIADALQNLPLRSQSSAGSLYNQKIGSRPASTGSFGSATSCSSASMTDRSHGRVKKRTRATKKKDTDSKRPFQCTFCCDSFKSKYDWSRHEKSLHLNLDGWKCAPFGGIVMSPDTGRSHCSYCSLLDPTAEHLDTHNHGGCLSQGTPPIFSRKDHLVQHLKHVHNVQTIPLIESWKVQGPDITSRCGFCDFRMVTWEERVGHLANHFRGGATMIDWKGGHDFEPFVAAKVTQEIPPFLIANESRALIPFSANNPGTMDQLDQINQAMEQSVGAWPADSQAPAPPSPSPAGRIDETDASMTFPEVLALYLGRYAQEKMKEGVIPSDKMFQDEARRIMFDSIDPFDQTIADNSDWLMGFRARHLGRGSDSHQH